MSIAVKTIENTVVAADLDHYDLAGLMHYLLGAAEARIMHAEYVADTEGTDALSTADWSAQRHGRSDLVATAEHLLAAAKEFAQGERGYAV